MAAKLSIKQILLSNQNWWDFYQKHKPQIRGSIVYSITKLLSCKNIIRGYKEYSCSSSECKHVKRVTFTCKCKACSSCGKKATELWIQKQNNILPKTSWQHITFTMPSELWDFFWCNRWLLNKISKLAANCIMAIANDKGITPGIFVAIHTFGRDLKRNIHIHLSTTQGGLSKDLSKWKKLFFIQSILMQLWRYRIITLFRTAYWQQQLIMPPSAKQLFNNAFTFEQFLDRLYNKTWIVHCAKSTPTPKLTIAYLGRYFKRPAIAESKLKHYDGNEVTFKYLDHTSKTYRNFKLSAEEFIGRFIQHLPDTGFRMIRYYGFLANRVRGKLLPIVYTLLDQEINLNIKALTFAELIQKNFGFNPFKCILCGQQMVLTGYNFGKTTAKGLLDFHQELARFPTC